MILYQSSQRKDIVEALGKTHPHIKVNVLKTFADSESDILALANNKPANLGKLILDSGTFSKNNSNRSHANLTREGYKNFLKDHLGKFDGGAFNYDEVFGTGGTQVNFANQQYLNHHGLNVIPVIQCFKEVEYYLSNSQKYPYVAIGSGCRKIARSVDGGEKIKNAVRKLHAADIKVHLFAEMAYNFLKDIPVYSSDAKSIIDWTKYRRCCFLDTVKDQEVQLCLDWKDLYGNENKDYYRFHPQCEAYEDWLYGNFQWTIADLNIEDNLWIANSYYYCWLEERIEAKHKENDVFKKQIVK
jgi:hypothetical protein